MVLGSAAPAAVAFAAVAVTIASVGLPGQAPAESSPYARLTAP